MLYWGQKAGDTMKEKRRTLPRWLLITLLIAAICFGIGLWYDQLCYGEIDTSDSAPTLEMLCHIAEHADELAARDDLFDATVNDNGDTQIDYVGDAGQTYCSIFFTPEASARLRNGADEFIAVRNAYYREDHSVFWDIVTPWSPLNVSFHFLTKTMSLYVHVSDAPDTSDTPLREMMAIIVDIIGTP